MAARFDLVTLDSPRPDDIARFWSEALELHETEREDGDRWIVLSDTSGQRRLGIQRGTQLAGSVHLDIACKPSEFDDELARLVELGASPSGPVRREPYGSIANLTDPDGNAFDLCAYE